MPEFVARPCERCGAGTIDNDYSSEVIISPMCAEVHLANGSVAWICFDCRKEWHHVLNSSELRKQYEEASFRYEFWKDTLSELTATEDLEYGLSLYRHVSELANEITKYANKWLAGVH